MSTSHDIDLHWACCRVHFSACDEYLVGSVVSEHINSVIRLAFVLCFRSLLYSLDKWHVIYFLSFTEMQAFGRSGEYWLDIGDSLSTVSDVDRNACEKKLFELKIRGIIQRQRKRSWSNGAFRNNSNLADRLLRNGEIVSTRCWSGGLYRTSSGNCVCKFFSFLEVCFYFRVGMRNLQATTNRQIDKINDDLREINSWIESLRQYQLILTECAERNAHCCCCNRRASKSNLFCMYRVCCCFCVRFLCRTA